MQKVILIFLITSLISCQKAAYNSEKQSEIKSLNTENKGLVRLEQSMKNYMKITIPPPYSSKDMERSLAIIRNYLEQMKQSKSKEEGLKIVKNTIIELNHLNKKCNGKLIETYERDIIVDIIINASYKKGYNSLDEDITLQWRDW